MSTSKKPKNNAKKPAKVEKPQKQETLSKEEKQALMLKKRKSKATPTIFKIRSRKATPIVLSLAEVREVIAKKKAQTQEAPAEEVYSAESRDVIAQYNKKTQAIEKALKAIKPTQNKVQGAASVEDILGFNPNKAKNAGGQSAVEMSKISKKFLPYYKSLIELRTQVTEGLDFHASETLKKSAKEDSGDLSGYSHHMADAGTDSFQRDLLLNMVSNEQEALYEIEEAIQRIIAGNYGVCEITGKPIDKERLMAIPFTRYSLEGRKNIEATMKHNQKERSSIFSDSSLEESAKYSNSDLDN